jgi:hypothetical protein
MDPISFRTVQHLKCNCTRSLNPRRRAFKDQQYQGVRACAIAQRTPKRKPLYRNIVQQALRTFKILQILQDIIGWNIGIYFPRFLYEFVRGEEVVKAALGL